MCKNGLNSGFLSHLSFIILSLGNVIKVNDNRLLSVIFFAKVFACDHYALRISRAALSGRMGYVFWQERFLFYCRVRACPYRRLGIKLCGITRGQGKPWPYRINADRFCMKPTLLCSSTLRREWIIAPQYELCSAHEFPSEWIAALPHYELNYHIP